MAVDMFLKIEDVKGESVDKTHKEEIDVLAWSWGMSNPGTAQLAGGAGAGRVNVQDLSFTKYVDKASTKLMMACCTGKHLPGAKLTVRKAGEIPLEYLVMTMTEVLVTGVSTGGSGGEDRLTENVTLNFAKFVVEYKLPQRPDGSSEPSMFATFNIAENVAE